MHGCPRSTRGLAGNCEHKSLRTARSVAEFLPSAFHRQGRKSTRRSAQQRHLRSCKHLNTPTPAWQKSNLLSLHWGRGGAVTALSRIAPCEDTAIASLQHTIPLLGGGKQNHQGRRTEWPHTSRARTPRRAANARPQAVMETIECRSGF